MCMKSSNAVIYIGTIQGGTVILLRTRSVHIQDTRFNPDRNEADRRAESAHKR